MVSIGARPNGTLIAFDLKTGVERWRALPDRPGYSAPIIVEIAGKRQVVLWTGDNVNGLDPATGQLLWQVPYKSQFDPAQATATPVARNDKLLCLAAWNRGSMMILLDSEKPGASILWKTRANPSANVNTPVFRDDKHIYTIIGDGALCCLDSATGDEIWRTREATSDHFGSAHIVTNGDRYFLLNQKGHLISAQLTPAGYQETGRTHVIEPTAGYRAAGPIVWGHPAFANRHVFIRNDRELVCVSMSSATGPYSQVISNTNSSVLPETSGADVNQTLSVAASPDGKTVAIGTAWGLVRQIDLATGTIVPSAKRHDDWVTALTYSPDGKFLISAGGSEFTPERNGGKTSSQIKVWDLIGQSDRGQLIGHSNKVFAAVFSPDGKTLATGAADKTIRLWNVGTMQETRVLLGHTDAISSLSWSRDGHILASASWDNSVKVWEADTGNELATLTGPAEEILSVAISPDGKTVAAGSADWTVRIWDLSTTQQAHVFNDHRGAVNSVAFTPDGKLLATGSSDETIKLWNMELLSIKETFRGHVSGVTSIAFSSDYRQLFTGAMDGPVRVWNLHEDAK
jgi:WD40 repeat protein